MRSIPALAALALLLSAGVVHGLWTERWARSKAIDVWTKELEKVPTSFGDWESTSQELDKDVLEAGEIDGYLMRRYRNTRNDQAIDVLIVCGRPGPISVHTPEACYGGSGYVATEKAKLVPANPAVAAEYWPTADDFWAIDFSKEEATRTEKLRILYAWNTGSGWKGASRARFEFAGSPALYKMYIVRVLGDQAPDLSSSDPSIEFVREFLPVLDETLKPTG